MSYFCDETISWKTNFRKVKNKYRTGSTFFEASNGILLRREIWIKNKIETCDSIAREDCNNTTYEKSQLKRGLHIGYLGT
jgi:hypothetical protein